MNRRAVAAVLGAALLAGACGTSPAEQRPILPQGPASASTPAAPVDTLTVVATGDVLIHPALTEQAAREAGENAGPDDFDYGPLLEGVRPLVSKADLALCHLEVPLSPDGGPYSGYPQFSAPPELADALARVGYDGCSTASNHVLDQGEDGVVSTLDALDEAGLKHTGSARTEQESDTPLVMDVGGVRLGHVSYTFGFNGIPEPPDKPWLSNELDAEAIVAEARAAREAGAEVVIVSVHWGQEYVHEPTEEQRALARRLLDEEAIDVLVGHHAHVVQPIERIGDKWVAYGLGNSVARHAEPRGVSEEGIAVRLRFTRVHGDWVVDGIEYIPTLVELGPPIRLIDLTTAEPTPRRTEALHRTDQVVLSRGGAEHGLSRPGR
ncbi:capsule synthesis protein PGA_cap [Saccharomonospora marina XMU15]|uniref:Capsule synthesis protein PGA_cap n=1 Tax=Saccharomonospora marina XMU15 TaxID=882083 RepID=H5X9J9_9PSEU|nr:CapA family protein [Saccharomonospora marina]EHR50364.1 capsule synthesis protein PGA_cap [Saccharomonospora marina XMU15]